MIGYQDLIPLPAQVISPNYGLIYSDSTGDKVIFSVPFKCEVVLVGVAVTGASTHATGFVLKFDKRPTAGSDTSRGDGDVGALSKTASTNEQGKVLYERVGSTAPIMLDEGDEVVAELTTAHGDSLSIGVPFVLVRQSPEDPRNNTAMVAA